MILASAYSKIHNEKNKLFEKECAIAGYKKRIQFFFKLWLFNSLTINSRREMKILAGVV